jgi:hypothetical protein
MADSVWFEIPGQGPFPNKESAAAAAKEAAKRTDSPVEIYRCTRTLVRTVQRTVTVQETDVPTA